MLIQHVLAGRLQIPAPVPVSVPWSRDTDGYIAGLRSFQEGDLDRWIEFAAMSIVDAVRWMHAIEQRLAALITSLEGRSRARGNSVAARVIRDLLTHPLIDAETVADRYGVSRQAAHEALTRLSEDGVLDERSFSRRTKAGRPRQMLSNIELIDLLSEIVTGETSGPPISSSKGSTRSTGGVVSNSRLTVRRDPLGPNPDARNPPGRASTVPG